ncbi:MAG: ROK family protein [Rhizobiales bacterium]|nr:ROK family protein [Hyphomicrobiales bacterium]
MSLRSCAFAIEASGGGVSAGRRGGRSTEPDDECGLGRTAGALAVDLGGTRLRAGRLQAGRAIEIEDIGVWPAPRDLDSFQTMVGDLVERFAVSSLGLAVPGLVQGTCCRWIPNLPYLDDVDVAELFPGVTIGIGNDAQIALLAEATAGAAAGLSNAILLAIGTGIGSAVLADGGIVRGKQGSACSFGWACADLRDRGHDRNGWLERMAAGGALDRLAEDLIGLPDGPALVMAARRADPAALAAIQSVARPLGVALAGAVGLLGPEVILLAGGVAAAADVLASPLLEAMRPHLPPHLRDVEVRVGAFGPRAGLVGAGIAAATGPDWWRVR